MSLPGPCPVAARGAERRAVLLRTRGRPGTYTPSHTRKPAGRVNATEALRRPKGSISDTVRPATSFADDREPSRGDPADCAAETPWFRRDNSPSTRTAKVPTQQTLILTVSFIYQTPVRPVGHGVRRAVRAPCTLASRRTRGEEGGSAVGNGAAWSRRATGRFRVVAPRGKTVPISLIHLSKRVF